MSDPTSFAIFLPVLGKRFFSKSVESLQQFVPVALESFSQPARDLKRGAGTAIFDPLEIGPINFGLPAKLLLRHPQVGAETADVLTKLFANGHPHSVPIRAIQSAAYMRLSR
jgi:hypothetical protein